MAVHRQRLLSHLRIQLDKTYEAADDPSWKPFVMTPPPNVTGSLHMGHELNNTRP
jgi:valyl-tRNA synthetase